MKRLGMLAACLAVVISGAGCSLFYSYRDGDVREIGLFGLPNDFADEFQDDWAAGLIPILRYEVDD